MNRHLEKIHEIGFIKTFIHFLFGFKINPKMNFSVLSHGSSKQMYAKTESRMSELHKHRGKLIVLVDQMGQHAGTAGKVLSKDGYDVRRLTGGMSEWQHQNMPVVQGKKS